MKRMILAVLLLTITSGIDAQNTRMREIQWEGVDCDSYTVYTAHIADTSGSPTVTFTARHDVLNKGNNVTHIDSFLVATNPKYVAFGVRAWVPDSTELGKLYSPMAVTPFVRADTVEIPGNFVILYNIDNTFKFENGKLVPLKK